MKVLAVLAVIVAVVLVGLHFVNEGAEAKRAEGRVERMMEAWQIAGTGLSGHAQDAICMWYDGTRVPPDSTTLSLASDGFDQWRREKDLYRKISTYSIKRAEVQPEDRPGQREVHVWVRIDGETHGMKVVPLERIEWLEGSRPGESG